MFKIARGFGILEKGIPYLIVTANIWENVIYLERFIFIVGQDETLTIILPPLRTEISTRLGTFPDEPKFELDKLLEEELSLTKQHYCSWFYEQIGDRAFSQLRHAAWQENNEIIPFALMYYKLNQEDRKKVIQIEESTICEDLKNFMKTIANLRLIIKE
ncbi:MAG: hypothetical protein Q8N62_02000 [Candidatus Omnitrophota bacterium]|nr:hypothetical protein [Candidatus Omnitrophota bacterium]